jgi:hypothetical protein
VSKRIYLRKDIQCSVLTGDEVMSSGDACLDGVSVTENTLHLLSVLNIVCLSLDIFSLTLTPSR